MTAVKDTKPGAAIRSDNPEERAEAARVMGQARTERKLAAVSTNIEGVRKPFKPLSYYPCTCGKGTAPDHPTTCPRGLAIRRRQKAGAPLEF